ncbi:MAG: efflux RND transporter periplasmic adaptor subunit [Armatimonadetes bacterium]|nr:efflux RND transporter periplasmic adaptor subunit [Armatimonadota bacterium]
MKIVAWALGVLLVVGAALFFWRSSQALDVRVARVERGDVRIGFDEDGVVRSDVEAVVAPRVAARVLSIEVKDGDRVRRGQVLARLDSSEVDAAIQAADADTARARAALSESSQVTIHELDTARADRDAAAAAVASAKARRDQVVRGPRREERERAVAQRHAAEAAAWEARRAADRYQKLYDQGYTPLRQVDAAQAAQRQAEARLREADATVRLLQAGSTAEDIRAADAAVRQAEAALQAAEARVRRVAANEQVAAGRATVTASEAKARQLRTQLADLVLTAPRDGVASVQDFAVGDVVPAGRALVRVVEPGKTYVEAMIDEMDMADIREGLPVLVTSDAWPDKTFNGRLLQLQGEAVLKRRAVGETGREDDRAFKGRVVVDDPEKKLRPGMSVYVQVITGDVKNVLTVPREALAPRGTEWFVWRVEGKRAERRKVETGARDVRRVEIKSGVAEGDPVIISGHDVLQEGAAVRVVQ